MFKWQYYRYAEFLGNQCGGRVESRGIKKRRKVIKVKSEICLVKITTPPCLQTDKSYRDKDHSTNGVILR